jgi:SAM-dependent methyltransferase
VTTMDQALTWDLVKHRMSNLLKIGGYRVGLLPHPFQLYSAMKIYELETALAHLHKSQAVIVDVCCGTGIQTQLVSRRGRRVVGIDHDPQKIRDAMWHLRYSRLNGSVTFIVGRAEALPLPSAIADAVVCLCAIEHVESPKDSLAEIARILKPGGQLCISADSLSNVTSNELRERHQRMYDVHRYYDVQSLSSAIESVGLHVETAFPIMCSSEAVRELERAMDHPAPCDPLRTRRLLAILRKNDGSAVDRVGGLFVFALASKALGVSPK